MTKISLSHFGRFLRRYRIANSILLKDMAATLDISPSYLSTLEHGKEKPSLALVDRIKQVYSLDGESAQELDEAYCRTVETIVINTSALTPKQFELSMLFKRTLNEMTNKQIEKIYKVLAL